jgi:hypothetical protein
VRLGYSGKDLSRFQAGLSAIGFVVLVCLICVVAYIFISMQFRSIVSGNEAGTIIALRSIVNAQKEFRFSYQVYGTLEELVEKKYVENWKAPIQEKAGYLFRVLPVDNGKWQWYAEAIPKTFNKSGVSSFYVDESGNLKCIKTELKSFVNREIAEEWPSIDE